MTDTVGRPGIPARIQPFCTPVPWSSAEIKLHKELKFAITSVYFHSQLLKPIVGVSPCSWPLQGCRWWDPRDPKPEVREWNKGIINTWKADECWVIQSGIREIQRQHLIQMFSFRWNMFSSLISNNLYGQCWKSHLQATRGWLSLC